MDAGLEAGGAAPRTLGAAAEGPGTPLGLGLWIGCSAGESHAEARSRAEWDACRCNPSLALSPDPSGPAQDGRAPGPHSGSSLTKGTEPPGRRRALGVRIPPPGAARCPLSQNPLFQDAASASPSGFLCLQSKSDA